MVVMGNMKFYEIVSFLDSMKVLYYLSEYVIRLIPAWAVEARTLKSYLTSLGEKTFDEAVTFLNNNLSFAPGKTPGAKELSEEHPLHDVFLSILEEHSFSDTPFYSQFGFGECWSAVENPGFVDSLFENIEQEIFKLYPQVVLPDREYKEGMVGIYYYDLAGRSLVFESETAAKRFRDENPVDESDYVYI